MKFGVELTPKRIPSRVFDADGREVHHVVEGATDTGEVVCLLPDPRGGYQINWERGEAARVRSLRPAPLTLIRVAKDGD